MLLNRQRQAENALDEAERNPLGQFVKTKEAQQVIDRAARIQQCEAVKRGLLPSPWEDSPAKEDTGPEFG